MDAKVGDRVVTPRIGKPVEVQALWLHALACAARLERTADSASSRATAWLDLAARGRARFGEVFWNDAAGCLYDVVDVDHEPGRRDGAIRPNQIFAVGGLGEPLITGARARSIVDVVETRLWTPMGLRSLAPGEPGYAAHYAGPPEVRDAVYHQGTVWPWFVGAFVDAWLRVHADDADAATVARTRFLAPLLAHLDDAGLGHVSEIADAEPPLHAARLSVPGVVRRRADPRRTRRRRARSRGERGWHVRAGAGTAVHSRPHERIRRGAGAAIVAPADTAAGLLRRRGRPRPEPGS